MSTLTLQGARDEAGNIKTFIFSTDGASWQAGQYQVYELAQVEGDDDAKKRYFTIASAPHENAIHISTRISESGFKQALNAMQLGDTIEAHDIEGDFTWEGEVGNNQAQTNAEPVVFVAGGIGVTPFRSILLERAANNQLLNTHMLYFGRDENFAFRHEFDELAAQHPELKIDYVVGERLSADAILSRAPEAATQVTYLSGPEPMVDAVGEELKARGVTIKQDWLPGYDDKTY